MAQFEIDIDLCLKDRRPFKVTNASKTIKKYAMASCLGELQWVAKQKLDLKMDSKIAIYLEKDGTKFDDQNFFQVMDDQTQFIAKEIPFQQNDNHKSIPRPINEKFKNVQIKRPLSKKPIGLKITGG
jgi:hypothetical protein